MHFHQSEEEVDFVGVEELVVGSGNRMVQAVLRYLRHICFHLVVGTAKTVVDIPVSAGRFLIQTAQEAPV